MIQREPSILYVITDLEWGGVPLHLSRLAIAMRARGFRLSVVSLASAGPVADLLRQDHITVHSVHAAGPWDIRVLGRLAEIMERENPDLVHAMLFHANVAARLAALEVGFPSERLLCEIQTVEVTKPWHLMVERLTYRLGRLILGNSPSVIEHLMTHGHIPRDALRLIRGGIDPLPFRCAAPMDRAEWSLPPAVPIVLWVGRLDPVKGLETLIDAFRVIAEQAGAHLLLVGDGPLRPKLIERIQAMELTRCVHLPGTRDDIPRWLKAADVFAFPSRAEGLPNALLEAMAAGCAIVATNVPGCRDLIEHERTGLLVPHGDVNALARAILRLLNDRIEAQRLGKEATQTVTQHWHIERTHDAYADLYRLIADEARIG